MNSTAFLRGGIAPTPPLLASRLPLPFRGNVSSSIRLVANENNNKHGNPSSNAAQRSNNGTQIQCSRVFKPPSSGSQRGGFPLGNTKMALQSLLCFSLDAAAEAETRDISAHKRRALQTLLSQNPAEAQRIMTKVLNEYQGASGVIKYEATMALIEVLIHVGTKESLAAAMPHLNDIEVMTEKPPSDAKRFLYRAVIYTLLDEINDAKKYWKTYTANIGSGPPMR